MNNCKFLPMGNSPAVQHAACVLERHGCEITDTPDSSVTHVLLNTPCMDSAEELRFLLERLPEDVTVIGGRLPPLPCRTIDLLEDPFYIAENANITAHCAIRLAMQALPVTLEGCPVLVVGWGRIGKCLIRLLRGLGADVTAAARKETDRAMLTALGVKAVPIPCGTDYRVIFNTVPEMVLPLCSDTALKIDLASKPGLGGSGVVAARGLPGKLAPESSGALIARVILEKLRKEAAL